MNIEFTEIAWEDFSFWIEYDENIVLKIKELINANSSAGGCVIAILSEFEKVKLDLWNTVYITRYIITTSSIPFLIIMLLIVSHIKNLLLIEFIF